VPFQVKGAVPLTAKIAVRLTPAEKAKLKEDAGIAGLSVSELVRRRYFGRPIVASTDMTTIRELRRLGGLLKHVHNESDGGYRTEVIAAIAAIRTGIETLVSRDYQENC
jgi:hypothetical protein